MEVKNSVYPTNEQIQGFLKPGPEGPICMVNLLKFKENAEYEDGRDTQLSGHEAYQLYEKGIRKILQEVGGAIGFEGILEFDDLRVGHQLQEVGRLLRPGRHSRRELRPQSGDRVVAWLTMTHASGCATASSASVAAMPARTRVLRAISPAKSGRK